MVSDKETGRVIPAHLGYQPKDWKIAQGTPPRTGLMSAAQAGKLAALYQALPSCRASNSVATSIPTGTATATPLPLDTETFDTDAFHSTTVNTSRLTVPAGLAGLFLLGGTCQYTASASGALRYASLRLNGSTVLALAELAPATGLFPAFVLTTLYRLNAGDYVELCAIQDSGAALNMLAGASCWLLRLGD